METGQSPAAPLWCSGCYPSHKPSAVHALVNLLRQSVIQATNTASTYISMSLFSSSDGLICLILKHDPHSVPYNVQMRASLVQKIDDAVLHADTRPVS